MLAWLLRKRNQESQTMKVTCQTEDVKKTLNAVQRAVASKGILPVLSNVLLSADAAQANFLKMVGTDLEIGIESRFEAQVPEPLQITLPAKKLVEIVNKFPDESLTFDFSEKGQVALLGKNIAFSLNTLPADDFPKLPQVQRENLLALESADFCRAIRQTGFAAATDAAKTILTGINLQIEGNEVRLAATDGYRLAVRQLTLQQEFPAHRFIIPKRTLVELEKLIKQDDQDTLLMSFSDAHILFESADKVVTSRLIEGKYPDYNKILPKNFQRKAWVETRTFLSAVERVAIMSSEQTHVISFALNTGEMTVSAGAEQGKAQESLPLKLEGDPLSISFNAQYLIEVLRTYAEDSAHLLIQMNSEVQPVVFSAVDNDDYVCMLMPIKP